jgi:chromatin remodeling complex protein RSC6
MPAVIPSPALARIVGSEAMPPTEVTRRLWAYIRKHQLQDRRDRRMVNADLVLFPVLGGKLTVDMFEMMKLVSRHLKPAVPPGATGPNRGD